LLVELIAEAIKLQRMNKCALTLWCHPVKGHRRGGIGVEEIVLSVLLWHLFRSILLPVGRIGMIRSND